MSNFQNVKEFMTAMEQEVFDTPIVPDDKTIQLRYNLIDEEVKETLSAIEELQFILDKRFVKSVKDFKLEFIESVIKTEEFKWYVDECFDRYSHLSSYLQSLGDKKIVETEDVVINFTTFIDEIVEILLVEIADGLSDILVVTYGAGAAFGIDLDQCMKEVHRSNMSKLHPETGKPVKRESDGKVIKDYPGNRYSPPDLKSVIFTY